MKKIETKKKVSKKIEPKFIVDLTNANTIDDVYLAFALAKHNAGLPINDAELTTIVGTAVDLTIQAMTNNYICLPKDAGKSIEVNDGEKLIFDSKGNVSVKKPNVFKRFWNWITRKK